MCHIKNIDEQKHIRDTFVGEPDGGPAPRFLARTVVDYIVYGSAQASPFDVPDQAIQESLIKVILRGNGCVILLYSGTPVFWTPLGQFKLD